MPTNKEDFSFPEPKGSMSIDELKSELIANREMTFGEKLVGLKFNPSNDSKVDKAKKLCAELADLVYNQQEIRYNDDSVNGRLYAQLYNHTIGEILNAQMNVVKLLTLKY